MIIVQIFKEIILE